MKREIYFFSSGFDSLGEAGLVVELDEAAPPAGAVLLAPVLPVLLELLDASAPGAGVGVVVVVLLLVLGDEAGGVVTVFSSFLLQAARPTTRAAAIMSERFMFFSSRETSHGLIAKTDGEVDQSLAVRERPTRSS